MYARYALPVVDAILNQASSTIKLSHRDRITTFTTEASSFSTRHLDNIDPTRVNRVVPSIMVSALGDVGAAENQCMHNQRHM